MKCYVMCAFVRITDRGEIEHDEFPGRPATARTEVKVQKLSEIVCQDRHLCILHLFPGFLRTPKLFLWESN